MAVPKHGLPFREPSGAAARRFVHCGAVVGRGHNPAQSVGTSRLRGSREDGLLRDELDADEYAMASLVDAVHWLRTSRGTGTASRR
jgi:hypothetical protein